jgi:TolB-like protein/Tfp pilus assembly protein PilF
MSFISELRRRNVFRVVIAYAALAWLLIQIVETLFPIYGLSDAAIRIVIAILGVGFIPVLVISWAFELTPDGLKRDSDVAHTASAGRNATKRLDRVIMAVLALALAYFAFDELVIEPPATIDSSIAVLPFVNMSSDPDQAYFAEGISEELLNLLAKIPKLRVTSRSSSFQFRGDSLDLRDVAAKLNVAHILEGSVRKAGNQVRITVQLIEAESDAHLWSETYDRPLDDIFAIQDDVAARVVNQLRLELLGETPKSRPVDPQAYTLMLAAREIVHMQRRDEYEKAEELLKKALEVDPGYVEALNQLALVYDRLSQRDYPKHYRELQDLMHETLARALELDPLNTTAMGMIAWDQFIVGSNFEKAARLYERATEIDPSNFYTVRGSALLAEELGNTELAMALYRYLVERDPMTIWNYNNLGWAQFVAGQYDEALRQFEMAASLGGSEYIYWDMGVVRLFQGDPAAALNLFKQLPEDWYRHYAMSFALHDLDRKHESAAALRRAHELTDENIASLPEDVSPAVAHAMQGDKHFARAYAWMGDSDEAFHYLAMAAQHEDANLRNTTHNPFFRKLHDDPRWPQFLESVGFAPEQLAAIDFKPTLPPDLKLSN